MTSPKRTGLIVTFYSYKGGTGRSMALANVAWILASAGKRVLVIDWDLEAPGLHRYFAPFLNDREMSSTDGLIDFVVEYSVKASSVAQSRESVPENWFAPYTNLLRYATSLAWDFPGGGSLDLVAAGRQGASYSTRVNSFSWQNFYDVLGGGRFLEAVKERLSAEYDYVLIDSRTGLSDTSGICTVQMPGALVVCFTLNNQSIDGAAAVASSVYEQRRGTGLRIFPVPMRTDAGEKEKLEVRREYARDKFDPLLEYQREEEQDVYWGEVEVPYVTFYAYEETLAAFLDRPEHRVGSLLAPAERLAAHLSGGELERFTPPTEAQRREVLAQFAGDPLMSFDLLLSHSARDEEWAARLGKQFMRERWRGRKLKVSLQRRDAEPGRAARRRSLRAASKSRRVAVIISPDHALPEEPSQLLGPQSDALLKEQRVIALYRRTAPTPEWMAPLPYIDFRDDALYAENLRRLLDVVKGETAGGESLPRLATAASSVVAVPRPAFGFVPRSDREGRSLVEVLSEMLGRPRPPAVALWGAGGVGKTALAAEAARRFAELAPRRVVWVSTERHADFSPVTFYDDILNELNRPDLLPLPAGAKEEALRPLLAEEPTLVVLDAFETVSSEGQGGFGGLLSEDAPCALIITSRQRVGFARNVPIYNFSAAEAREFVARWESKVFGDERGAQVDMAGALEVTDGNPLALELLLAQFEEAEVFHGPPPPAADQGDGYHVTRVFDGAFRRLEPPAREALLALSLFVPSASRQSLAEVAGAAEGGRADGPARLIRLRLARATEDGEQFSLEGATRHLAAARLNDDPSAPDLRGRFVAHFLRYAEEHGGGTPADLAALSAEKENLLRAMDLAFGQKDWGSVVRLGSLLALGPGALQRLGYVDEAIKRCEQGARAAAAGGRVKEVERFIATIEAVLRGRGEFEKLPELYERSLGIFENLGSSRNVVRLLLELAERREEQGDLAGAAEFYDRSRRVSVEAGYPELASAALRMLGSLHVKRGETQRAEETVREALAHAEKSGDKEETAAALSSLGNIVLRLGEYERARPLVERSLQLWRELGNKGAEASNLLGLAEVFFKQENRENAERFYHLSLEAGENLETDKNLAETLSKYGSYVQAVALKRLGELALGRGDYEAAELAYTRSLNAQRRAGRLQGVAQDLMQLGHLAFRRDRYADARRYFEEGLEVLERLGDQRSVATALTNLGVLAAAEGNKAEAVRLLHEALSIYEQFADVKAKALRELLAVVEGEAG